MHLFRSESSKILITRVGFCSLPSFLNNPLEDSATMTGELFCKGPKHRQIMLGPRGTLSTTSKDAEKQNISYIIKSLSGLIHTDPKRILVATLTTAKNLFVTVRNLVAAR